MKRVKIYAAMISFCLLFACGCNHSEPQPPVETPESVPVTPAPVEPAPAPEVPAEPVSAPSSDPVPAPETITEPEQVSDPAYLIRSGVWLAKNDLGYSNYYHFDHESRSGSYQSLDYGLGSSFSYEYSGSEVLFLMSDGRHDCAALEEVDEETFILQWDNALPETLSFVQEGTLDEFHFYSNDDLCRMAAEHYSLTGEETPEMQAAMTNEDNSVTVQLYDNLGDHNSTAAWYIVDRFTAEATNLLTGEEFALEESEAEFPTFPEEHIFLEQTEFVSDNNSNL